MKQLQNNYTTPEQSKRLLDIGVPADSADMFLAASDRIYPTKEHVWDIFLRYGESLDGHFFDTYSNDKFEVIPCWSVGRLMEICDLCNNTDFPFVYSTWGTNRTDYMIKFIESSANCGCLDFSKLEE